MKARITTFACAAILCGITGCRSVDSRHVSDPALAFTSTAASSSDASARADSGVASAWSKLDSLRASLNAKADARSSSATSPLLQSALIRKSIRADFGASERIRSGKKERPPRVRFKKSDFTSFLENDLPTVTTRYWRQPQGGARSADDPITTLIQKYLVAYTAGKFVDRTGARFGKPEVKSGIGNDTIVGFTSVVLAAIKDHIYPIPVYYKEDSDGKRVYFNAAKTEPTFAAVNKEKNSLVIKIDGGQDDISEEELQVIQFVSKVAGEQSGVISGMVFRLLSDVQVSFVVGGSFAVGDNETLAKVVDVFFSISARRLTEAAAYEYFRTHSSYDSAIKRLLDLVSEVYSAIE